MKHVGLAMLLVLSMMLSIISTTARAATDGQINQAIEDGLKWLSTQQNANGGWYLGYTLADTGTALLAFENEGHFPGGGSTYSAVVEKGLDHMFLYCYQIGINNQTYGYAGRNDNPDSNGNGKGIYFAQYSQMYETGIVMQAIADSNTPDRVVPAGNCAGMTYKQVLTDVVDWVAWGQVDAGPGRGGWYYWAYNNGSGYSDNSAAQWPVLGMIAAENWGIYAPSWVKSEMNYWVNYIQGADGASGYNVPNDLPNIAKTGGLLVEMYYLGDDKNTLRASKAINYINAHWNEAPSGTWWGNKGQPYAMFAVFKGLELMQVSDIPNAPANPDTVAGDWWGDYAHYLVNTQTHPTPGQGYWGGYAYWNAGLATPWYIVILQATVFPVTVKVSVPDSACNFSGYDATVEYSVERFTANGTVLVYKDDVLEDTITLTDFKGTGQKSYTISPADNGEHHWKAVLDVTGGGISAHAEATDAGTVYDTPQVSGIPDQSMPFESIDLDLYRSCANDYSVTWSATGVPAGWTVDIVGSIATVTAPDDATEAADITFVATAHWPTEEDPEIECSGSDTATFEVNRPPVADAGAQYGVEEYEVDEGGSVIVDGSDSYDPDGDPLTYAWDLNDDGIFETPGVTAVFSALGLDGPGEAYVRLQVCDPHGACDIDIAEVEVENVPPAVDAGPDATIDEGDTFASSGSFTDPGPDTWAATVDYGDGTGVQPLALNPDKTFSLSHVYGDNGTYTVAVVVCDDDGGCGSDATDVTVSNVAPGLTLDTGGAISFAGGDAFLGRAGAEQAHQATATDPGSDDLTFDWDFGVSSQSHTYYNDGVGPDPLPSPDGTYPVAVIDTGSVTFSAPGVYSVDVQVADDDWGTGTDSLVKLVTGDCDCAKTQGFWRHQFSEKGKHQIDDVTLQAYLDIVNFASGVFSESTPASTIGEARAVFDPRGDDEDDDHPSDMKGKATRQALAAWLNFAKGAVGWDEVITIGDDDDDSDDDDGPAITLAFHDAMAQVEAILLDPDSTHADYVLANRIASSINEMDEESDACEEDDDEDDGDHGKGGDDDDADDEGDDDDEDDEEDDGDDDESADDDDDHGKSDGKGNGKKK